MKKRIMLVVLLSGSGWLSYGVDVLNKITYIVSNTLSGEEVSIDFYGNGISTVDTLRKKVADKVERDSVRIFYNDGDTKIELLNGILGGIVATDKEQLCTFMPTGRIVSLLFEYEEDSADLNSAKK